MNCVEFVGHQNFLMEVDAGMIYIKIGFKIEFSSRKILKQHSGY